MHLWVDETNRVTPGPAPIRKVGAEAIVAYGCIGLLVAAGTGLGVLANYVMHLVFRF